MKDITLYKSKELYFKRISSKKEISSDDKCDGYFIDADEKTARSIIASLGKTKKQIAIQGRDSNFNRRALETLKINYLVSPENLNTKDSLKQRDSGLNHVLAKIAKNNKITILINFSEIQDIKNKKQKSVLLSKIIQNIKICRKVSCQIKIASLAKSKNKKSSEDQRKSFAFSLGMSSQQVKNSCQFNKV